MELTTILIIKNRPQAETMNCLESLYKQNTKIILVDYGSSDENLLWERVCALKFNLKLIEVKNNTEIFNKSRAINIGIKEVDTEYVMLGDIDNIYKSNFVEEILASVSPKKIVSCLRYNTLQNGDWEKKAIRACGGCLVVAKDWLMKIHGFDEKYTLWGAEDDDLVERATKDGLELYLVPLNTTFCVHQWHLPSSKTTLKWNRQYFKLKKPVVRNGDNWGNL
jgi:glycosyltransferase involved in cell wall biosynthesis